MIIADGVLSCSSAFTFCQDVNRMRFNCLVLSRPFCCYPCPFDAERYKV